jgi:hypothetical protein
MLTTLTAYTRHTASAWAHRGSTKNAIRKCSIEGEEPVEREK